MKSFAFSVPTYELIANNLCVILKLRGTAVVF